MEIKDKLFLPTIDESNDLIPARVSTVHRGRYTLLCKYGEVYGRLKTTNYYQKQDAAFPVTGDYVSLQYISTGDSLITATLPRKTFFGRRDPTPGRGQQGVAANFDYVFLLQSLNQDFNPKRLERYLSSAWQSGAIPVVLLTKSDLTDHPLDYVKAAAKVAKNVGIYPISVRTGAGLKELEHYLQPGKTAVLLGSSGVGKSSLINFLRGNQELKTQEIRSQDDKGKHTTTHRELFLLPNGAMVIDTPGMRELGMWDEEEGIEKAFRDVEAFLGKCKFSDCKHQGEPGCAVKQAIRDGKLSQERWNSYQALQKESEYASGKDGYLKKKKEKFRKIAQSHRGAKEVDYRSQPCTETFICKVCGKSVAPEGAGSNHRNHCPHCLSSLHVDSEPGDRASLCKGIMDPIGVWVRKNGEWAIIHRCRSCGKLSSNRIAADDNPMLLLSIAVKPLSAPPFPLDQFPKASDKNAL